MQNGDGFGIPESNVAEPRKEDGVTLRLEQAGVVGVLKAHFLCCSSCKKLPKL